MSGDLEAPASIGVCGAGVMGSGIAQAFAVAGHSVHLVDNQPGVADAGVERIKADLRKGVAKGKVTEDEAGAVAERLVIAQDLDELNGSDIVVEAVVEELSVKQELFRSLEAICSPKTLLVTNTSTLSPTEVAAVLDKPGRAAGVHFFNPANRMRLVEVVPSMMTEPDTVTSLNALLESIGKQPVHVNEAPGGIVSRLQLLVRNEAVRMVSEGVATPEDIDTAMRLGAGWPLGPLELIDLVGVDMHVTNCASLAKEFGSNRYAPHPMAVRLARAGRLGRKSGRGFYSYDEATGS